MSKEDEEIKYESEDDAEGADKKVKKIKDKFKLCEKERAEYLSGWQRARADYINLEKRITQEKEEWIKFSNLDFIIELLPVLDSFDKAADHCDDEGVKQIYKQLISVLKSKGLEPIKAVGEKFNPEIHEVIAEIEGKEQGIIIEEVQKGYTLHNKVIRVSKVKIGK